MTNLWQTCTLAMTNLWQTCTLAMTNLWQTCTLAMTNLWQACTLAMTNLWQACTLVMTNLWQACCKLKLLSGNTDKKNRASIQRKKRENRTSTPIRSSFLSITEYRCFSAGLPENDKWRQLATESGDEDRQVRKPASGIV
ncbi:hypothetical protein AVEN_26448-1 [Araneus ventricosus]|uniref:Uncharacterized protein n=1 Tax=Araneus ventricosus TaxID=182803 RepID=A0A4Y2SK89_ARAVE|nr:hypothetical protein AVEN_26448-1 [Araneus ventricosus]